MELKEQDKAPAFSLPDQDGKMHKLSDYKGSWLLVYFYPRDFTPGCVKEACTIRDVYDEYKKQGVTVLGISTDTVESHKKMENKHSLPFTLLADEEKKTVKDYGVYKEKNMFGRSVFGTKRTSFLIDPKGKIEKIYLNVKPAEHASEVLADVKELMKKD